MKEVKYKPFTKAVKGNTASIRRRIEHFTGRSEHEEETFEIKLLPLEKSIRIRLTSYLDNDEYMCTIVYPMLIADMSVENFTCKYWAENLAGEKIGKSTRKLIFNFYNSYLVTSEEPDDYDERDLLYYIDLDFGRYHPSAFFTYDIAILCLEISYRLSIEEFTPGESDFRRNLWEARNSGLSDLTLVVGDKEIKISRTSYLFNLSF
jgi:hypothetical protein